MSYRRELELTVDRLRQLSQARLTRSEEAFYGLLAGLTERPVPRIGPQAWGDQLWVIGRDAPETETLAGALRDFRRGLDITPLG